MKGEKNFFDEFGIKEKKVFFNFHVTVALCLHIILLSYCTSFVGTSESPDRDCCEPLYPFIITNNTRISGKSMFLTYVQLLM